MRPVRGLGLVSCLPDVDWRISFIAALRAQVLVWGGQGNLLVPVAADVLDHPAFWAIVDALDPDALILHPGAWGDLRDVDHPAYAEHVTHLRAELTAKDFSEEVIEQFLSGLDEQHLHGDIDPDRFTPLLDRGAMLHHDGTPETGVVGWKPAVGYPWVNALDLRAEAHPSPIVDVHAGEDLDLNLLLASSRGQLSSAGASAVAATHIAASRTSV